MKRDFFRDDLRTMSVLFLLAAVIAIVAIGGYSIFIMVDALAANTESRAVSHLESADSILIEKTKNIQRFVDILHVNAELQTLLNSGENRDSEIYTSINGTIAEFEDIEGCVLINSAGRAYVYNLPAMTEDDLLQLQVSCSRLSDKTGQLKWYNADQSELVTSAFSDFVLCGTNIYSDSPVKLYLFVRKDTFSSIFNTSSGSAVVAVLDSDGGLIIANDKAAFVSLFYSKTQNRMRLYEAERGFFPIENDEKACVGVHYQSSLNDFKFLEIYPRGSFYGESYKILLFMLVIILLFLCILAVFYLRLSRRFIMPLKELSYVMQNFDDDSLDTQITVRGNNEVSMLSAGFNGMVVKINQIIENIRQKEEEQKQSELLALRSQIRPHFIYNTLNSIKILALYNQQSGIATALQRLARLLKNTFSSTETFSPLSKEIEFIKDYIDLLQVCYKNQLDVSYCIEQDIQECVIPIMILQPIVENAINHGLAGKLVEKNEPAKLYVHARREQDRLLIEITDSGIGMSPEQIKEIYAEDAKPFGGGIGLKNIIDRIKLLYGEAYGLTIKSKENFFTTVQIWLPLQ